MKSAACSLSSSPYSLRPVRTRASIITAPRCSPKETHKRTLLLTTITAQVGRCPRASSILRTQPIVLTNLAAHQQTERKCARMIEHMLDEVFSPDNVNGAPPHGDFRKLNQHAPPGTTRNTRPSDRSVFSAPKACAPRKQDRVAATCPHRVSKPAPECPALPPAQCPPR